MAATIRSIFGIFSHFAYGMYLTFPVSVFPLMANVLIVDDERDTRQMLQLLMESEGHTVTTADNGWEALTRMHDAQFDLILLDIMMPGLDGAKFLQILRQATTGANTPVVAVTALDKEVAQARIGSAPVEAIVIKKPDRMVEDILATVRMIVGPHQKPRGGAGGGVLLN